VDLCKVKLFAFSNSDVIENEEKETKKPKEEVEEPEKVEDDKETEFEQVMGYSYFESMYARMKNKVEKDDLADFLKERPVFSRFLKEYSLTSDDNIDLCLQFLTFMDAFTAGQCICQVLQDGAVQNTYFRLDL
jgi:hypothetical protein